MPGKVPRLDKLSRPEGPTTYTPENLPMHPA